MAVISTAPVRAILVTTLLSTIVVPVRGAQRAEDQLAELADRFVQQQIAFDPTLAYAAGLQIGDHSRLADRSQGAIARLAEDEGKDLAQLHRIDRSKLSPGSHGVYAALRERLEADLQLRVCKSELWNVNHFSGWQSELTDVAEAQPVTTAENRAQALRRWESVPHYLDVELDNLRLGLSEGYSAPKSVVRKVIAQTGELGSAPPEKSDLYSPAARAHDAQFQAAFKALLVEQIDPAVQRYHDFLRDEYLPRARDGIAVSDLPHGKACYRAFLRANTTLNRSPWEVFRLGAKTVARNETEVAKLGKDLYGVDSVTGILSRMKAEPDSHFESADELLAYSRKLLLSAKSATADYVIGTLPQQDVVIEPEHDFEEAAGVDSHYEPQPDPAKPAVYRIQLGVWKSRLRGQAAITLAHETWPGHHLQIALSRELGGKTQLSKLISNSAYEEGWARYAERLAEEADIYDSQESWILRRIWPAHGMVVDTGIHALHWTRSQAIAYLVATGVFNPQTAEDMVDRIAVLPGQLTSYDSGGLEILRLRQEAKRRLGTKFDLKSFNRVVIEDGVVPLPELHQHVQAWIRANLQARPLEKATTRGK